jgi:nucleotide-binding universal stress UspA family protein
MTIVVWLVENTWQACVQAVPEQRRPGEDVVLLHVSPAEIEQAVRGAQLRLLGRGRPGERDPGRRVEQLTDQAATALLDAAQSALGGAARRERRRGRVEREVVAAAAGARLLVLARDGDQRALGPRSLGPASRFVVDHAPCAVLLIWPDAAPALTTIPPPPSPGHPPPPGHRPPPG